MEESRIARIELRVDEIKDDVSELKADSKIKTQLLEELKEDFKEHTQLVKYHVMGDDKIISNISPLLPDLKTLLEDYNFQKKKKEERMKFLKDWSIRFGFISGAIGVVVAIIKIFG